MRLRTAASLIFLPFFSKHVFYTLSFLLQGFVKTIAFHARLKKGFLNDFPMDRDIE